MRSSSDSERPSSTKYNSSESRATANSLSSGATNSLQTAAHKYTQSHVGGMQPVTTIGEKVEAAYLAGALAEREGSHN